LRDELRLRKLDHRKLYIGYRVRAGFRHHKLPLSAVSEFDGLHLHLYVRRCDFWDHLLSFICSSRDLCWKSGMYKYLFFGNLFQERFD